MINSELIVDNFAGGGGASTGIELATGRPVDIAINHDPYAILMHQTNHPYTKHYCESVWDVNPTEICAGRSVGLMWLSPDCKHFSRAKGGKPVDKNVRGLAWIALRWAANLIQYHSEQSESEIRGQSLDKPIMTVDMSNRYALTAAHIVKYYKGDNYSSVNDPLHTVTVKERNALVESHLCVLRNNMDCKPLTEPLPTECTSGGHFAEIRTRIVKYEHGAILGYWDKVRELLNKYCGYDMAGDEILLLEINGEQYFIADIGMRMLEPRELYLAQGFPADYIIDHDYEGNRYPRTQQVARCGNAVPPPFAEALVRANLPEMCGKKFGSMEELREAM